MNHSTTIVGDETLVINVFNTGPLTGKKPRPPTVISQIEITMTSILKPLRPEVMQLLTSLIKTEDHKYWFLVYLSIFVLYTIAPWEFSTTKRAKRDMDLLEYIQCKTSLN